jgi:hypothetical protein
MEETTVQKVSRTIRGWIEFILPRTVVRIFVVYSLFILIHYLATHLYTYFCTPLSFSGIIMSPFLVPSPHCEGLRWVIYHGAIKIKGMWILLGGYIWHFMEQWVAV